MRMRWVVTYNKYFLKYEEKELWLRVLQYLEQWINSNDFQILCPIIMTLLEMDMLHIPFGNKAFFKSQKIKFLSLWI